MSDITGSTGIGEGFTLAYDVNPTAETAMISLKYGPVTVSQATLTSSKLTTSIGGNEDGVGANASITANWITDSISYSASVNPPVGKTKKTSGTLVSWT